MSRSRKWPSILKASLLLTPMLVMSLAGVRSTSAAPAQKAGPTTWTAYMGHEVFTEAGNKPTWEADAFYPATLTIHAGDSVMWKHNASDEVHTVTFLGPDKALADFSLPPQPPSGPNQPPKIEFNPKVFLPQGGNTYDGTQYTNSGVIAKNIPGPQNYTLTFSTPGTFTYYCSVHAANLPNGQIVSMQAKIIVLPADAALPMTPAQVESAARAEMAADDKVAMASEPDAANQAVKSSPGANGSTVYHVNVGYEISKPTYAIDYMRFAPKVLHVNVGDTVDWSIPTPHGFHNVHFGTDNPAIFNIEPQPNGPPKAFLNLAVFGPVGPNVHTGTGEYSGGIIVGQQDLAPGSPFQTSYSLTFAQAGSYHYICALHDELGMEADVLVGSGTSTPGMPTTGSGSFGWMLGSAIASGLLLLTGGVALRFRVRRASVRS